MNIELPSDAASASQSGKHCLFHPSTDEAHKSDATSIELPSDSIKLLRPSFQNQFNCPSAVKVHPPDSASCSHQSYVDLPSQSFIIFIMQIIHHTVTILSLTGKYNHLRLHCSLGKVLVSSRAISTLLGLLAGLIRSRSQRLLKYFNCLVLVLNREKPISHQKKRTSACECVFNTCS